MTYILQVCWVEPKPSPLAALDEGKILWSGRQARLHQPTIVVPSVDFDKTVSLISFPNVKPLSPMSSTS